MKVVYECYYIFKTGIDPRSNADGSEIEAIGLEDVVITDGNGTIISHHAAKSNNKRESESQESSEQVDSAEEKEEREAKDRSKREAPGKNENGEDKSDVQPVSFIYKYHWARCASVCFYV